MEQQIFIDDLKGKFYLRKPNESKPSQIQFIISFHSQIFKIGVEAKVYPKQWNQEEQRAIVSDSISSIDKRNNIIANIKIAEIRCKFERLKQYICIKDFSNLSNFIYENICMAKKEKKKEEINIIDVIKRAVINDATIRDNTKDNYTKKGLPALKFYLDYLETNGKRITNFSSFTTEFFNGFSLHILNNYFKPDGEPYAIKSINSILKYAKSAVVLGARTNGYLTEAEIASTKLKQISDKSSDNRIALRNDEVIALYNYKCQSEEDEIVRDMFLLECTLGHRISDILKIGDKVEEINGNYYISLAPQKTPKNKLDVNIIFEIAKKILIDKYGLKLPKFSKDLINDNIKRIAKEAGVLGEELQSIHYQGDSNPTEFKKQRYDCISTHTGRITFITLLSARGWTYEKISKYTGQSIKMVEHYDKSNAKYIEIYKKTSPDKIVRLLDDPKELTKDTSNIQGAMLERLEEKTVKIYQLEQQNEQLKKEKEQETKQLRHVNAIERQISDYLNKCNKELIDDLKNGFTYEKIKKANDESDNIEDIIESFNLYDYTDD